MKTPMKLHLQGQTKCQTHDQAFLDIPPVIFPARLYGVWVNTQLKRKEVQFEKEYENEVLNNTS